MNPVSGFLRLAAVAGVLAPAVVSAQGRFDGSTIPLEFLETSPWTVSAGLRFATEGASVGFGELGRVEPGLTVPPLGEGNVQRNYHDGAVGVDGPRTNERDAAGNVFSQPGGRYEGRSVDNAGNEIYSGDYLSYTEGRTRNWSYVNGDQVGADGRVAMHRYSTTTAGGTAYADGGASGGFEVNVNRRLRRWGKKAEFGVNATFGLNDIDATAKGSVQANLVALTDYYNLYGSAPEAPFNGPKFEDLKNDEGVVILTNGREITVPIDQLPSDRETITIENGATVFGNWKINGAYYVMRVGPSVRIFFTPRLAVSFEGGFAAAFVGSRFQVEESVEIEGLDTPIMITEEEDETEVLTGYYGAGAVEYWMTDRTNAHAGAAYESLGRYQQSVNGRTAEIDVGSTITVRLGLTTRF